MNAPIVWILIPFIVACLLWLLRRETLVAWIGGSVTFLLALSAWVIPFEEAIKLGALSFKVSTSLEILGRRLTLTPADQPVLALVYGSVCFWFIAAPATGAARRLVPLGLAITALLIASIAVEPFLYAALLIEMAVLMTVPLLLHPQQAPGRGLLRFIIFQTLAMPFILFSGWLLAGIEASPGDLALVVQTTVLLGIGFALLLFIFPFHTWIPMLVEETHTYSLGFLLWIFPIITLLFGLGFIDHYTWLRESTSLPNALLIAGELMVVTGGLWAAFQKHLGKIFGYAIISEIGLSLLALSLGGKNGINIFFLLLIPRLLGIAVWAFSLTILQKRNTSLDFDTVRGVARSLPVVAGGIILSGLSLVGLPLLASFPIRQTLWERLAERSFSSAIWFLLGNVGLIAAILRSLAVLVASPERTPWKFSETRIQRLFIGLGGLTLLLLGLFPQWVTSLLVVIPTIFVNLGR